jgi:hypothetical protein
MVRVTDAVGVVNRALKLTPEPHHSTANRLIWRLCSDAVLLTKTIPACSNQATG